MYVTTATIPSQLRRLAVVDSDVVESSTPMIWSMATKHNLFPGKSSPPGKTAVVNAFAFLDRFE
jgi:hypothetical protein